MKLNVFALNTSRELGEQVAKALDIKLSRHEERDFEDGEHKSRPLENVRGRDVFVIQSLYGDNQHSVNDKLVRLLFFLGALRDASAGRITAVIPYLCYARKDQKSKPRDPVATRYLATLFEAVGVNHVVALDVHNLAAYQNAFRICTDHLEAKTLFANYFANCFDEISGDNDLVILSPDIGGVKRAEALRLAMEKTLNRPVASAFVEKHRSGGVVSGGALVGEVSKKTVIIIDDLISSGTTIIRAAQACRGAGATKVYCAASHGAFSEAADAALADPALDKLVITDSIPPKRITSSTVNNKLVSLPTAPLFAEAIKRMHTDGSLVDLLES
jgi:ribose-phosphate pyrophosphokinase